MVTTIASVDFDTWSVYSSDPVGTTWDIIDGAFVKLKPMEQRVREKRSVERSFERGQLYEEADRMISKHGDFVALDQDPDGSHAHMISAWRIYKMNVRGTQEQIDYPDDVIYPKRPEA